MLEYINSLPSRKRLELYYLYSRVKRENKTIGQIFNDTSEDITYYIAKIGMSYTIGFYDEKLSNELFPTLQCQSISNLVKVLML